MTVKGFTYIEFVSVLVIVGVMSVAGANRLSNGVFDERFLFEDALSAVRYGQMLAIGRGCPIQFSIDQNSFQLMYDVDCSGEDQLSFTAYVPRPFSGGSGTERDDEVKSNLYINRGFPAGLSVTSATIVFYPQGWACVEDGSRHDSVTIIFSGAVSRSIRIECGTGFIYPI